jgi:hypothetical protein
MAERAGCTGHSDHISNGVFPPPPLPPPVLTPPQLSNDQVSESTIAGEANPPILTFREMRPIAPQPITIPGKNSHSAKKIEQWLDGHCQLAAAAGVEMVMTIFTAEFSGVCGVDGLNRHCAPAGSPCGQERVTARPNENP